VNARDGQTWNRVFMHLSGKQVLAEATIKRDIEYLLYDASVAVGVRSDIDVIAILRILALVVPAAHEVPLAAPMVSTFGGEG